MKLYNIKKGPPRLLHLKEEILLTQILQDIIVKNNYRCVAYTICLDLVEMILVCHENELDNIIQKMKSISSKLFHRSQEVAPMLTKQHQNRLWSQKFYKANLGEYICFMDNKALHSDRNHYIRRLLSNITHYRHKLGLTFSQELVDITSQFIISEFDAFHPNFSFKGS